MYEEDKFLLMLQFVPKSKRILTPDRSVKRSVEEWSLVGRQRTVTLLSQLIHNMRL